MEPSEQVLALRQKGGFARLPHFAVVEVTGPDAAKYLQARLSNDVSKLGDGQGQMSALLDRKAYITAYFSLHRINAERFLLLMERKQLATVLAEIEKYHFQEKIAYRELAEPLWTVQGGAAALLSPPDSLTVLQRTLTGDTGLIMVGGDMEQQAIELGMVPLCEGAMMIARVEGGLPMWNVDYNSDYVMPETGLENIAASYSKGCFQGQEVLARVRTYGAPKRGLVGLMFAEGKQLKWALDLPILRNGEEIGTMKSNLYSPTLGRTIALAYVQREYRVPDQKLQVTIGGADYEAIVVALPFYSPEARRLEAKKQYDRALTEFTTGSEAKAVEQLREVVKLDPLLADAYEALGVALSRQDQVDEAISVMKQLERLDPDSIMAHANLSVFYMQKGNKEAAEEEKAKAMSIRMSKLAREFSQQQADDEALKKRKEEAEGRMNMFRQVLDIDKDDFLANAGMGSAYVDLEKYADALPFLEKALQVRPSHTVAYVSLAQTYEKLGQTDRAIETYKQGVAIAAQRGDMTPMKAMQAELDRLRS